MSLHGLKRSITWSLQSNIQMAVIKLMNFSSMYIAETDGSIFVRISNSEIVNLKKVRSIDLSFVGTICMEMTDGEVSYVSRRYVSKIKKILGL